MPPCIRFFNPILCYDKCRGDKIRTYDLRVMFYACKFSLTLQYYIASVGYQRTVPSPYSLRYLGPCLPVSTQPYSGLLGIATLQVSPIQQVITYPFPDMQPSLYALLPVSAKRITDPRIKEFSWARRATTAPPRNIWLLRCLSFTMLGYINTGMVGCQESV